MSKFKDMTNNDLRQNYAPAVYQPGICKINYQKLWDADIRFLFFDIDDTIADLLEKDPSKEAMTLFADLKARGFEVWLLSNTWDNRVSNFAKKSGLEERYIALAKKPLTTHFTEMQERCGFEKSQMAYIGNSLMDDIAEGNVFGIVTCLVRRAGGTGGFPKCIPGVRTEGQKLRKELKKRGIWRKHHKYHDNDQYYQLGETPGYVTYELGEAYARAMQSSEKAYIKSFKKLWK